jgi:hypothetical protein
VVDDVDEVAAAGCMAVIRVGSPEHGAIAVHLKAAWRWAVADDAAGADTERGVERSPRWWRASRASRMQPNSGTPGGRRRHHVPR